MSRFTKRHFVWHKNPQKLEGAYLIQFLLLSLNMDSVFKFLQWSPNGSQFSFFFKNFTYNFFVYFTLLQISGDHATSTFDVFIFEFSKFFLFWSWQTAVCRVKIHKNEKWILFGGRWIFKAGKNIFQFRKKFCIILSWWIPWVFLCRTNIVFMNRDVTCN